LYLRAFDHSRKDKESMPKTSKSCTRHNAEPSQVSSRPSVTILASRSELCINCKAWTMQTQCLQPTPPSHLRRRYQHCPPASNQQFARRSIVINIKGRNKFTSEFLLLLPSLKRTLDLSRTRSRSQPTAPQDTTQKPTPNARGPTRGNQPHTDANAHQHRTHADQHTHAQEHPPATGPPNPPEATPGNATRNLGRRNPQGPTHTQINTMIARKPGPERCGTAHRRSLPSQGSRQR